MKPDFMHCDRHEEPVMVEELTDAVEAIETVAEAKGLSFDQVAGVYHSQSLNRLAEILADAADERSSRYDDLKEFISKELDHHRNWCYDNQPLKIQMEK